MYLKENTDILYRQLQNMFSLGPWLQPSALQSSEINIIHPQKLIREYYKTQLNK